MTLFEHRSSIFNQTPKIKGDIPANYDNPIVSSIREKLGNFDYNEFILQLKYPLEERDMIEIENGSKYKGQWFINQKLRERVGKGIQIARDGSLYEGWFGNNLFNGKGRLINADGDVYEGYWKDGKADGIGVYAHYDGQRYEGKWKQDKQHGHGFEKWPDGSSYQGEYSEGKKHGLGKFSWPDGSVYNGNFSQNNIEG